jgi:hypothetical protein
VGLHTVSRKADVVSIETIDMLDDRAKLLNPPRMRSDVDGDHPDPVTLSEPAYDDQGLLRWGSMPSARG